MPQKGRFGVNLPVYLIMLKFSLRGVLLLRRIKDFAFHLNAFEITPKGIQDAILRVGQPARLSIPRISIKSKMQGGFIWT